MRVALHKTCHPSANVPALADEHGLPPDTHFITFTTPRFSQYPFLFYAYCHQKKRDDGENAQTMPGKVPVPGDIQEGLNRFPPIDSLFESVTMSYEDILRGHSNSSLYTAFIVLRLLAIGTNKILKDADRDVDRPMLVKSSRVLVEKLKHHMKENNMRFS